MLRFLVINLRLIGEHILCPSQLVMGDCPCLCTLNLLASELDWIEVHIEMISGGYLVDLGEIVLPDVAIWRVQHVVVDSRLLVCDPRR